MNAKAAIILFLVTSIVDAQELPVYWSKSVIGPQIHVGNPALVIFAVGYTQTGYYAYCGLSNQTSNTARVIGARDDSGEFRAKATLSVSGSQDGPWTKVADIAPGGQKVTLIVDPHSDSEGIVIDLEKLAPLIDKFEYARICLPTGETTIFSMKELKH